MPRESTITYDHVAAVADAIKAQGGRPTSRNVRERIGQGSMGTIHRMLSQWQAGQARSIDATLALPPALQRAILDFMSQELASARAALEAELTEAQQAGADLATENERIAAENDGLRADIARQHDVITQVSEQRNIVAQECGEARKALATANQAAEAARTELAKAQLRLEAVPRIEADLERLRGELEDQRKALAEAEKGAASAEARAEGLAARLNDAVEQHKQALSALDTRMAELQRRLHDAEAQAKESADQAKSEMLARVEAEAKVAQRLRTPRSKTP